MPLSAPPLAIDSPDSFSRVSGEVTACGQEYFFLCPSLHITTIDSGHPQKSHFNSEGSNLVRPVSCISCDCESHETPEPSQSASHTAIQQRNRFYRSHLCLDCGILPQPQNICETIFVCGAIHSFSFLPIFFLQQESPRQVTINNRWCQADLNRE